MAVVTVDNTNLTDMITELGGTPGEESADKPAADKPAEGEAKPADKPAEGVDAAPNADAQDDADDVEGEDGLTARQKRELSAKMLKAIGKKHRQVKEAEEFAADQIRIRREAEGRATELDRQIKAMQQANKPAAEEQEIEPSRSMFATETDYMDARIKWGVDQGIKERETRMRADARLAEVKTQFQRAAELVPDFEDVTNRMPMLTNGIVSYMQESDMFAELGYHFAKNPKVAERLVSLSAVNQLVEIGKIEATLKPFGSSESSLKADDKSDNGKGDKPAPSTVDTGFSPSKARSDAPVIKPLTSSEGTQVDPDARVISTRQAIESFQRERKVNLQARKRH